MVPLRRWRYAGSITLKDVIPVGGKSQDQTISSVWGGQEKMSGRRKFYTYRRHQVETRPYTGSFETKIPDVGLFNVLANGAP